MATVAFVLVLVLRASYFSAVAPFGGWQVDVMAGAIAATVVAVGIASVRMWRRAERDPRVRSPYRLVVVLAVLWPGLGLGALASSPIGSAVSWASNHTAAAAAAQAEERTWLAQLAGDPPFQVHSNADSPPAAVADRLLHTTDLGAGWYDVTTPNPIARVNAALSRQGVTQSAESGLTRQHRSQSRWVLDELVVEDIDTFDSPAQAQQYARVAGQNAVGPCGCASSAIAAQRQDIGGVAVWMRAISSLPPTTLGAFAVGRDAFVVKFVLETDDRVRSDEFSSVMSAAIHRATDTVGAAQS
jgi:hypothetical protein